MTKEISEDVKKTLVQILATSAELEYENYSLPSVIHGSLYLKDPAPELSTKQLRNYLEEGVKLGYLESVRVCLKIGELPTSVYRVKKEQIKNLVDLARNRK